MADQLRWFKVWTSIVANARFAEMSLEDIGRWTLLGAATALDGDRGRLEVPGAGREVCRLLRVSDLGAARAALSRLGSVTFEEGTTRGDVAVVTWRNWTKYQRDTTQAERQKASRAKRRGEKRREEEKRLPPLVPPAPATPNGHPPEWPQALIEVRDWLVAHEVPAAFLDPVYWRRVDDWLGSPDSGVAYLSELPRYLAHQAAKPPAQRQRNVKQGFRNWLAKSEYWSQSRAQTRAIRDRR